MHRDISRSNNTIRNWEENHSWVKVFFLWWTGGVWSDSNSFGVIKANFKEEVWRVSFEGVSCQPDRFPCRKFSRCFWNVSKERGEWGRGEIICFWVDICRVLWLERFWWKQLNDLHKVEKLKYSHTWIYSKPILRIRRTFWVLSLKSFKICQRNWSCLLNNQLGLQGINSSSPQYSTKHLKRRWYCKLLAIMQLMSQRMRISCPNLVKAKWSCSNLLTIFIVTWRTGLEDLISAESFD